MIGDWLDIWSHAVLWVILP